MSTFEPHPLASVPILTFPTLDWIGSSRQLIQVMGDTVVIHVSCENASGTWEDEIVAWNWKTGNVMGRIAIGRTAMACSFCMLTPTTIAVARPNLVRVRGDDDDIESIDGPAILLISFTQRPKESDGGQPPNADDPTTPHAVEVTKLMMPPLIDDVLVVNFHMRPDPAYPVRSASDPTLGRGKPFTQDSTKGVVVSDFWLSHAVPFRSRFYELFMLRETLVEMATDGEARLQKSWDGGEMFDTLSVPWSNWGEHNTRLMDHVQPNRRRWVSFAPGPRTNT
jgi:hypothetical protein